MMQKPINQGQVDHLKPKELRQLVNNQKEFEDAAPVTTRATFKLSNLEALIREIKANPEYANDDDFTHNICITFVRDELKKELLWYTGCHNGSNIEKAGIQRNGKHCTQLIPIITGCLAKLDPTKDYNIISFKYMRDKETKKISYVRSGGEGTGLIPPPPPPPSDDKLS